MPEYGHCEKPKPNDAYLYQVTVRILLVYTGIPYALYNDDPEEKCTLEICCRVALKETVYDRVLIERRLCLLSTDRSQKAFCDNNGNYDYKDREQDLSDFVDYLARVHDEPVCYQVIDH